mgnify:CR=1 FL=1
MAFQQKNAKLNKAIEHKSLKAQKVQMKEQKVEMKEQKEEMKAEKKEKIHE